ncbi:MAG TPA: hypothetical protein VHP38_14075 [Ruminiclostridium sp.]|nr:hypothetical protein [Ruminiclostridium sp.]
MKGLLRRIKKEYVITALVLIGGFSLLHIAPAVMADTTSTSTSSSPVIYDKTYIDALETKLTTQQTEAANKIDSLEKEISDLKDSMTFKIIKLQAGQTLVAGESSEIIVRTKNKVVAYVSPGAAGGVSNLISGKDIKNGETIPDNQLLLVPKSDGRGIKANAPADIMIKGTYTIQ